MSATAQRNLAMAMAKVDFDKAIVLARKVTDPWFRCQALAEVARHASDRNVVRVAQEAMKSARVCVERYQQVAAAVWPLEALIVRGKRSDAVKLANELIMLTPLIEHPVNRMDAAAQILAGSRGLPSEIRRRALDNLLIAAASANSWKAGRTLRDVVESLSKTDPSEARRMLASMKDGAYERQAERILQLTRSPQPPAG